MTYQTCSVFLAGLCFTTAHMMPHFIAWWENLFIVASLRKKRHITRIPMPFNHHYMGITERFLWEHKSERWGKLSVSSRSVLMSPPAARACWDSTQRWSQGFSRPQKMSLIPLVWLVFCFFLRIASDFSLSLPVCVCLSVSLLSRSFLSQVS